MRYQIPLCFVVVSSYLRLRYVVLCLCAVKEPPAGGNSKVLVLLNLWRLKLVVDRGSSGNETFFF